MQHPRQAQEHDTPHPRQLADLGRDRQDQGGGHSVSRQVGPPLDVPACVPRDHIDCILCIGSRAGLEWLFSGLKKKYDFMQKAVGSRTGSRRRSAWSGPEGGGCTGDIGSATRGMCAVGAHRRDVFQSQEGGPITTGQSEVIFRCAGGRGRRGGRRRLDRRCGLDLNHIVRRWLYPSQRGEGLAIGATPRQPQQKKHRPREKPT